MEKNKTVSSRDGRQSNIELLRIITAMGVIILHYNNSSIGGAFAAVPVRSRSAIILYFLEALFIGSVDLFMMILGYFQARREKIRLSRPLLLLLQVGVVRLVWYVIYTLKKKRTILPGSLLKSLLPVNYFIVTYCTVYILSPYVNKLLASLGNRKRRTFLITLLVLFSVLPTICMLLSELGGVDTSSLSTISSSGKNNGYTVVNYLLMYTIGATMQYSGIRIGKKSGLFFLSCLIPQFLLECALHFSRMNLGIAHSYSQPLVIGCAFFALQFFLSLEIGVHKWINRLASGSLMVYLVHKYLLPYLNIPEYAARGEFVLVVHLCATCLLGYLTGWILAKIYGFVMKPVENAISKLLHNAVLDAGDLQEGNS